MIQRAIEKKDYKQLLELDKKVYPTNNPVTSNILDSWYHNNPEFGIIFENRGKIQGMCIAIPLNELGWNQLIKGDLSESELNDSSIFKIGRDTSIGIHIYHIEKLDIALNDFYKIALKELGNIITNLQYNNFKPKILGFSGFCVTSSGIGLFYNKFNCREHSFLCTEHILKNKYGLKIITSNSKIEVLQILNNGFEYINRCKMLVVYPNEVSIVWSYITV